MLKKTLSFLVVIGITFTMSINSVFAALSYKEVADKAILLAKSTGTYNQYTVVMSWNNNSTIWFQSYEIDQLEWAFKIEIENLWTQAQTGNTWFITYVETKQTDWNKKAYDTANSVKTRAMAMFMDKLYTSYVTIWNNPDTSIRSWTGSATIKTGSNNWSQWLHAQELVYTQQKTYQTASNKSYTVQKSQDGRYWFNTRSAYGFKTLATLYNYLEYQNRIIYKAPNGRMYGVFKQNNKFYFNRDEWSVSTNSWVSVEDVKAYINQHNQPVPWCTVAKEWRCY